MKRHGPYDIPALFEYYRRRPDKFISDVTGIKFSPCEILYWRAKALIKNLNMI